LAGIFVALFFANIIPDPLALKVEGILSIGYAIGWVTLIEVANRGRVFDSRQRGQALVSKRWCRIPLMFLVGLMFGYTSCVWAYPWLITEIFGTKDSLYLRVIGWEGGGRTCSRPSVGHRLFVDGPRALCVSSNARARMPVGAYLRIVGPKTSLGMNSNEIYVLKSPPKQVGLLPRAHCPSSALPPSLPLGGPATSLDCIAGVLP
jgi:hypothetical protein